MAQGLRHLAPFLLSAICSRQLRRQNRASNHVSPHWPPRFALLVHVHSFVDPVIWMSYSGMHQTK